MSAEGDHPPCDVCGRPVLPGQARYSLGDRRDAADRVVSSRHWECHTPVEVAMREIRDGLVQAEQARNSLKGALRR